MKRKLYRVLQCGTFLEILLLEEGEEKTIIFYDEQGNKIFKTLKCEKEVLG